VAVLVGEGGGGRIAGCFNINNIARGLSFEADVNWWISSDCTGRGLATEGAKAVLDFALADMPEGLGLHMIHGGIVPDNTANIRVALKAGMHHEPGGQSFLKIGSRWVKHELYVRRAE
jgi:ribosomal-protein-alanine N-acetyltransferase